MKFEIRIEPAADGEGNVGNARGLLRGHARAGQGGGQIRKNGLQIIGGNLGGIGAAPVQNDLHHGFLARGGPAVKFLIQNKRKEGALAVNGRGDVGLGGEKENVAEGGRTAQPMHDVRRQGAAVMIQNGHVHVADFERRGPAEHDYLHQGRHNEHNTGDAIAEKNQQLLSDNGQQTPPVRKRDHRSSLFCRL